MLHEANIKTFDQIFDRFEDLKKHQFRILPEIEDKIINAFKKHYHEKLNRNADNLKMTTH
jgi:hypothetical protein